MIDDDLDLDERAGDETIDVTRIDADPAEADKLQRMFRIIMYRQNIMHIDEFANQYLPLFRKDVALNMDPEQLKVLSSQYMHRVDLYNPVYVVRSKSSTKVGELLSQDNVLFVLPAMYSRTGVVNNLGQDAINSMQAFNNIVVNDVDDRFDKKKIMYANALATIFNNMNDDDKHAEEEETAKRQAQIAVEASRNMRVGGTNVPEVQNVPEEMLAELDNARRVTDLAGVKEVEEPL